MHTQSAIGQAGVPLGPHGHQGARNARTLVRSLYIEILLAIHPWADFQDLRLFLMGFDAGETLLGLPGQTTPGTDTTNRNHYRSLLKS